ncbi:argininosuccinate synthase [Pseudidiomarina sp. 1APP75-27a]|uniref:argininosuccinate synthase n=1 Tax=Pseudidiomarina terrestris TaxID=2820060 RepID=UPI00264B1EE2|nr:MULTISPECIES: argininosuccinate synthase [unclassified Pseudidiomarina]MDN7125856.1 argininosuccinate synthase [Pseudidiomarina sp. 1APR75-33.1]MDN7138015.1 argininosuccinate synthase [Pseudidiomarina sp. 1ASP75-14]MEA3588214.1 argininosuccinate synthase [Pseudidiomarina sp. 1APP75-27a]
MKKSIDKVVLAYSGGLDTSAIVPWLKENYDCEVVAFVADVGQGDEELAGVEEKAIASGASSCHVVDLKQQLVNEVIFPTLKTGAIYEGQYLLGTALARPIIAAAQVEIARKVGADALAHGCTGKGNDQVRFESAFAALAPDLQVIAPWREWDMRSRPQLLAYLAERNIPCSASATKIYSRDANLWHISTEGGELEDPWNAPTAQVWSWTTEPLQAPDVPEYLTLSFLHGEWVALNGEAIDPVSAITQLNHVAGAHGVGRLDMVENRLVGMKSRGCYETPAGAVLYAALQGLESLVLDRTTQDYRIRMGNEFAQLLYDGRWFTPLRDVMLAAANKLAEPLTGDIVVKLYKGQVNVTQKRSPNSLYSNAFATFDEDDVYNQQHAEGFIRLYSLASRIRALHQTPAAIDGDEAAS